MVSLEHHNLTDVWLMCLKTSLYPKQTVSAKLKQISLRFWESALATHPYPNPTLALDTYWGKNVGLVEG